MPQQRSLAPRCPITWRAAALALSLVWGTASAQPPELPPNWFPNRAPSVAGQAIPICIDAREPAHEVDRDIAAAISSALLIEFQVVDVDRVIVVEAEYEDLFVDLVDRCTAYLGFKLYPGTYPEWLTFTRPSYEARFVVLSRTADGYASLDDLPPSALVGTVQGTLGDVRFLTHNNARTASARFRRIPLGEPRTALAALVDGRVDALVIWEPWWWSLAREDPRLEALRPLEAPVVSEPWIGVGAALLTDRTFARVALDDALRELAADGTIAGILADWGFPGRAPR
jgi:polar amino acid transport system substrate-binding protein